jgi:hypothetical protein
MFCNSLRKGSDVNTGGGNDYRASSSGTPILILGEPLEDSRLFVSESEECKEVDASRLDGVGVSTGSGACLWSVETMLFSVDRIKSMAEGDFHKSPC